MIAYLSGIIKSLNGSQLVLNVNGVGYEITCSNSVNKNVRLDEKLELLIHTEVKEDSITLYGFSSDLEKRVFQLLKTVKGLGAKSASEVISRINADELLRAIANDDLSRIQAIKGIGKKTAERIVLELRDKVQASVSERSLQNQIEVIKRIQNPADEALEALCALGFMRKEAQRMLAEVIKSKLESEVTLLSAGQMVSEALRYA
jgi:Holliday junction DNA helicase RuvA